MKFRERKYIPRLIAWEVTRTCNLQCRHCRAGASEKAFLNELSTEEIFKILRNIASFCKPIIILTGGEPMLRQDIFEIAQYGTSMGLKMVMAPCGYLITEATVEKMKNSGISRISLSIDGATEESHDSFRNKNGAFKAVMQAAEVARKADLDFQINTTVYKGNIDELPEILDLAIRIGAKAFHPFLLVPTGRAKGLKNEEILPEEYENVLNWVYEMSKDASIFFKPTCAPHYHRIVFTRELEVGDRDNSTSAKHRLTEGCMGGKSFAFISHTGKIYICGFLEVEAGDLRKENYDFLKIWNNSPLFNDVRNVDNYGGKCGYCEYRRICGGCRARAYAMTGDYLEEEPFCIYTPKIKSKLSS